jgi:hypothetical protein
MDPVFTFTKPMMKSASVDFITNIQSMTIKCLKEFPELNPKEIKFSYTKHIACAMTLSTTKDKFNIGYNPRYPLFYNVLGHELMHFAQEFGDVPHSEKSCDVYTLARSELFTDDSPGYIPLPIEIVTTWSKYAADVRDLCIQAIEVRKTNKQYIKWVTKEIRKLVQR